MDNNNHFQAFADYKYISKHHAQGNDFIIAQGREDRDIEETVIQACHRKDGVSVGGVLGADGFIQLNKQKGKILFKLWNADGSVAEVSGNGLRCSGQALARRLGKSEEEFSFKLDFEGKSFPLLKVSVTDGTSSISKVRAEIPTPVVNPEEMGSKPSGIPVATLKAELDLSVFLVDTGNPHIVVVSRNLNKVNFKHEFERIMLWIEGLDLPESNIEFIKVINSSNIQMLVYERGVGSTQACGSGAVASVAALRGSGHDIADEVDVHMDGGIATVYIKDGNYSLGGEVHFTGIIKNA